MRDDQFTKDARGEFRGDFSRDTFDPMRHFSRVLMQQGRVQVDADWNEQVSILLHYMRQLGADLMGPHGAPIEDMYGNQQNGFHVTADENSSDLVITSGVYYVNGIRCENEEEVKYSDQPNCPFTNEEKNKLFDKDNADGLKSYLVYLDVWERHLTYVEDDYMREKALGGADTAARAQIVWQVKVIKLIVNNSSTGNPLEGNLYRLEDSQRIIPYNKFLDFLISSKARRPGTGQLKARAKKASGDDTNPCLTAPEASYRGVENQLYRVEIHNGSADKDRATFKWSRENGSVIFPITNIGTDQITLEHLGRDDRFGLQPGDWVEVLDDDVILRNEANPLLQVTEIDRENFQVTLTTDEQTKTLFGRIATDLTANTVNKHPYLRRWDQKKDADENGVLVQEKDGIEDDDWLPLEDGVKILFQKQETATIYQTGDYWIIPARTATGDVEWPGPVGNPDTLPPQGVEHHYAPLAIITVEGGNVKSEIKDLRRQLNKGWIPS